MTGTYVTDEVWEAIPTRRLPRRRVLTGLLAGLLVAAALLVAERRGVVSPQLSVALAGWDSRVAGEQDFASELKVTNDGVRQVRIESVEAPSDWLRLGEVRASRILVPEGDRGLRLPAVLQPGETIVLKVPATVTDCARISRDGVALLLTVDGPVHRSTLSVNVDGGLDPDAPDAYSFSGRDPWVTTWPAVPAGEACGRSLPEPTAEG